MASNLRLPINRRQINGQFRRISAATELCSITHGQNAPPRCGGGPVRRQMLLLNGSSLSLSRLFYRPHDRCLDCSHCQVPCILPHPSRLRFVQEELLGSNPNSSDFRVSFSRDADSCNKLIHANLRRQINVLPNVNVSAIRNVLPFSSRGFCSERYSECESSDEEDNGQGESCKSETDPVEVERICKVIDELFAIDRNMEAVLDECGINLTDDLVVDVLERFKHARRPAFRFFCWAGKRPVFSHDSRTYNCILKILGKAKQFETMLSLIEEMGEKGLLTLETFQISIKAFAAAKERKKAVGMFELMKKYNFRVGVDTINVLLDNLGRAKLVKEAHLLFDKLRDRFTPNMQTYTVLINGWCRVSNLLEAGKLWNEMVDKGLKPDIVAHNTMLEGLVRVHKRSDAMKLFEVMRAKGPSPNVRSYTIFIRDLCKQGKMKDAVECFEEMINSGCEPDAAIYTCLITGFGNEKKMDKVYGLLKEMKEKGCHPDVRLYNALIKLMTNRQMSDDAVRIYKKMIHSGIQPSIHTYNMMMKSFFRAQNYDMGCAVWDEMNQKGVCPDDNSYVVYIGGLIKGGRSVEACKYLEKMMEKGMKAPQLDYNKFAADFSKAGRADILEELAQKMKSAGKFEVSNIFAKWSETTRMKFKRVNL